ncbi:class I SAM-dependent methyltransferase [Planctomycetota bacterium]
MTSKTKRPMQDILKKQQDHYDEIWRKGLVSGKEQRGNFRTNVEFLTEIDLIRPDDRILEIGCGIGSIVSELSKQGYHIIGTDISNEAIAYGLKKYGDIDLQVRAAENLPFEDKSFNIVLSFDLFEHIARIDKHIAQVNRVLCPGGYYIFQTPNKYSNVIFETCYHKSFKWKREHPSLHTPGQLKRRLSGHGFEVRFVKMNPVNEFTLDKLRKRFGLLSGIFKHINFCRLPVVMQTNLYVIAQKISGK